MSVDLAGILEIRRSSLRRSPAQGSGAKRAGLLSVRRLSLLGMTLTSASLPGWCSPEAVYVARDTLLEIYSPPSWAKDGLCRDYPHINWFPAQGESSEPAKAICRRCAVRP